MKPLFIIIAFCLLHTAYGQKQTVHRLMRIDVDTFGSGTFKPYGTHRFYYSGNRGGVLDGVHFIEHQKAVVLYSMLIDEIEPTVQYDSVIGTGANLHRYTSVQQFDKSGRVQSLNGYYLRYYSKDVYFDSFSYDIEGRLLNEYTRNSVNSYTIHYNESGMKDTLINGSGDTIIYVYDADHNIMQKILKMDAVVNTIYTYEVIEGVKKLVSEISSEYGHRRFGLFYSYNSDSIYKTSMRYNKMGDKWEGTSRVLHIYDNDKRPVTTIWYMIDDDDKKKWIPISMMRYSYNNNGLLKMAIEKKWDTKINSWQDNVVGRRGWCNAAVRFKFSYATIHLKGGYYRNNLKKLSR